MNALTVLVLALVVSLSLAHMHLGGEYIIIDTTNVRVSFVAATSATGATVLKYRLSNGHTIPSGWIGIGFQNGNMANASAGDLSMYGPSGGGADYFIIQGSGSSSSVEQRNLNSSMQPLNPSSPTYKGVRPNLVQTATTNSTPTASDRIRDFKVHTSGSVTTYTVTVNCAAGSSFTNLAENVNALFAWGAVASNMLGYHGNNRYFKRTGGSSSDLSEFKLCGPNAGGGTVVPPMATTVPATTGSASFLHLSFILVTVLALLTQVLC